MEKDASYKASVLSMIPEDWDVVEFEDVLNPILNKKVSEPFFTFIGMQDVSEEAKIINQTILPISQLKSGLTYFEKNDVLVAKITPCFENGKGAYANNLKTEIGFGSTEFHILRANQQANAEFIYYWTINPKFRQKLTLDMVGSAGHKRVPFQALQKFQIPLPPFPEQSAIATALSDTDALISSLQTLIAKKKAIKLSAMQNLLSGKIRLPEFAQRPDGLPKIMRQTELGCVPEDWEVVELGSVAFIKTGSKNNQDKKENGQYPFFVRSANVEQIDSYSYDCEAILIPGEGNIGSIFHYINGKFDAHQRVYVIRDFKNVIGKFVFFALKQSFGKHAMENTVKATVDSLRLPTFQNFKFAIPKSTTEQTAIAQLLSDMDAEIEALEGRLKKTQALKQGMMQALLTGKIRLPLE